MLIFRLLVAWALHCGCRVFAARLRALARQKWRPGGASADGRQLGWSAARLDAAVE
jgi:hypothetical protein